MKCHDLRHTSQSPYSTADTCAEKWRFKCDSTDGSPVICDDGTIYFGDFDDYLYSLYPNGTMKWKYKTGGWIWSAPAIGEDGNIYIGSYDCKLHAIYPNGTLKWKFGAGGGITSSPAISADGTIYFGTMRDYDKGDIIAVNPNGTEKWRYTTGYYIASDPAIGDDGTIYIGSGDTYLYAMNPDGTLKWRFKTGDIIKAHPSIAEDGTIYIASFDHYLYALYPNGTLKWKRDSGYSGCSSVAIGEDGTLYFGSLYAAYPNNGTTKWNIDIPNIDHSSFALSADDTIYAGADKYIIAIDLNNGVEKCRKKIANDRVQSSPSICEDGTVYIGSSSYDNGYPYGYLHAFGTVEDNEPPTPPVITGPTSGNVGDSYTYSFVSNDPENYPLKYYVEWGDNTSTGWTWEYDSDEEVEISHKWVEEGTYTIRAKAMDISDYESEWGYLEVTMPVNYQSSQQDSQQSVNPIFLQVLQRLLNIR